MGNYSVASYTLVLCDKSWVAVYNDHGGQEHTVD